MLVVDSLLRTMSGLVAPAGPRARLPILFYHRVLEAADPLLPDVPDVRLFERHMSTLARIFNVIDLEEGIAALRAGTLRPRSVCVSFDDGYRDNVEIALPVLRQHRIPATFFVASGFLGTGRMFVDTVTEAIRRVPSGPLDLTWFGLGTRSVSHDASRLTLIDELVADIKYRNLESRADACARIAHLAGAQLPRNLMMSPEQLRILQRAGMAIGGHTVDHPILVCLGPEQARRQIADDRSALAAMIGEAPRLFAYPNGKPERDLTIEHARMVRDAGYAGAVTTAPGCAGPRSDPFMLPRQSPWQRTSFRLVAGIARSTRARSEGREPAFCEPVGI
jgi:peptidoglycan/xylan/chitin deacetylase (PgdA/CDA1 family)